MKNRLIFISLLSLILSSCTIFDVVEKQGSSDASSIPTSQSLAYSTSQDESSSDYSSSSNVKTSSSISENEYNPADYYGGYYVSLTSWNDGEDLKNKLHSIISGGNYSPLPYTSSSGANWESLKDADEDLYDHEYLDVLYSADNVSKANTNTGWQREHAFCASLMCGSITGNAVKTLGRATDWHNLFAGSSNGNTSRGNKNYGVASTTSSSYQNRTTPNGYDGYSYDNKNFEPGNKDKGRVSRAIFYMATMYTEDVYDQANKVTMKGLNVVEDYVEWPSSNTSTYSAYSIGNLSTLLEWSKLAVDLNEYHHNESVYSYTPPMFSSSSTYNHPQGNRNPYVDYPELVDYVFGSKKNQSGELKYLKPSAEELNINSTGTRYYAIKKAKREYGSEETFSKTDINVVAVDYSFNETNYSSYTLEGATDGKAFSSDGNQEITIKTPVNDIKYTVVVGDDVVESSLYNHEMNKTDFSSCSAGVTNSITLSSLSWNVYWKQNSVASNNAKGVAFGAGSASKTNGPIDTLYFETADSFVYNNKNQIKAIYLRGSAASKTAYNVKIYVADTIVCSTTLGYKDSSIPVTIGVDNLDSLTGKVKIEITNITAAVYIKNIAIDAI